MQWVDGDTCANDFMTAVYVSAMCSSARSLVATTSLARPFSCLYNHAHQCVGCNMVDSCSRLHVTASYGKLLLYYPVGATAVAWVALKAGMG